MVSVDKELTYLQRELMNCDSPEMRYYLLQHAAQVYVRAEGSGVDMKRFGNLRRLGKFSRHEFYDTIAAYTPDLSVDKFEEGFIELRAVIDGSDSKSEVREVYERLFRLKSLAEVISENGLSKGRTKKLKRLSKELQAAGSKAENIMWYGFPDNISWNFDTLHIDEARADLEQRTKDEPGITEAVRRLNSPGTVYSADWVIYLRDKKGHSPWFAPVHEKPAVMFPEGTKFDVDFPRVNLYWLERQFKGLPDFRRAYLKDLTDHLRGEFRERTGYEKVVLYELADKFDYPLSAECSWVLYSTDSGKKFFSFVGVNLDKPKTPFKLEKEKVSIRSLLK